MPIQRTQHKAQIQAHGERPRNVTLILEEPEPLIQSFTSGDTTPSVAGHDLYKTANSGATTISDFDDGRVGQRITVIIDDANTTIDFTSSGLKGNESADWSPADGDHMTCVYDGTHWLCNVSDN